MNYGLFSGIGFLIFSLVLTIIELIFYFIRKNKLNILSKIFLCEIIFSILTLSTEIISIFLLNDTNKTLFDVSFSFKILTFFQLILIFTFILYFGYLFLVDPKNINKKENLIYVFIFSIISIFLSIFITCFIPFTCVFYKSLNIYLFSIDYYKIFRFIGLFIIVYSGILLFFCKRKIKAINLYSIYFSFSLYAIVTFYSFFHEVIFDFTLPFYALIVFLLFLSIENQDHLSLDNYTNINDNFNKISKSKKYFSSNLSHFYRSRFSTILGLLSVHDLEKMNISTKDLNRIEEANNYLLNVSSSIVDIFKIDNNSFKLDLNKYKIINLLNKINNLNSNYSIQLHSNNNLDTLECYGYEEVIYKIFYYLVLSSTYKSSNNDIDIDFNVNKSVISCSLSFYNENINNDIFNQNIDDYLNGLSSSIEDYNTYLIASKCLSKYINIDLIFTYNEDNICLFKFDIPIVMTEITNNSSLERRF